MTSVGMAEATTSSVESAVMQRERVSEGKGLPSIAFGDAYVAHFTLVLRTVACDRADLRRLYSRRELALAEHFLNRLTPLEQHVYARLFQRKGPWFKTASLLSYFTRKPWKPSTTAGDTNEPIVIDGDDDNQDTSDVIDPEIEQEPEYIAKSILGPLPEVADHRQVQHTIQTLVNSGLLVTLPLVSPMFMSKEDQEAQLQLALEAIQLCATTGELQALWKQLSGGKKVTSLTKTKASPSRNKNGTDNNLIQPSNSNGNNKADILQAVRRLVATQRRIDGSRIPVAKMMHIVWMEGYPLLQQRNSKDEVILVVRIADAARELFARMHRLFYHQAALPGGTPTSMPASARVKTFPQIVQERTGAGQADSGITGGSSTTQQWPGLLVIFKKIRYPQYKISINHPIFRSSETYICYEIASRLHRLVNALEFELLIQQTSKEDDKLPPDWVMIATDEQASVPTLTAFQRLKTPTLTEQATDEWQGRACIQFEVMLAEWKSLDEMVLEVRKCLKAYSAYHLAAAAEDTGDQRPVFFVKCNAGYHLSRVLHHASSLYERLRQYSRAVEVLRDLLAAPVFLSRKCGYWWERLALNYEHLKQYREAKRVCEQALDDPVVLGAAKLAIQRRYERLLKRKQLKDEEIAADITSKRRQAVNDKDDFVGSVFADEEDNATMVNDVSASDNTKPQSKAPYEYTQNFIIGRPLNKSTNEKSRFVGYDDEQCNVEQLVLQYYHSQRDEATTNGGGWYGVHCEGRVLTNVFGLFMWDVLYAPVPDVFQSAYQAGPLDFGFADAFYTARREQIDALLDAIENKMSLQQVLKMMAETWRLHDGEVTRFVSWSSDIPLIFYQLVVAAMGKKSLARLLKHMTTSEEYHRAQNGLPDLLMVRVQAADESREADNTVPMDSVNPKAVDMYKYCGMVYSTNANSILTPTGEDSKEGDAPTPAEDDGKIGRDLCCESWDLELKLVEVKGPRDRLSDQQVRWLELLNEDMGIDASVMHVVEEEKDIEKKRHRSKVKEEKHDDDDAVEDGSTDTKRRRRA